MTLEFFLTHNIASLLSDNYRATGEKEPVRSSARSSGKCDRSDGRSQMVFVPILDALDQMTFETAAAEIAVRLEIANRKSSDANYEG